MDEVHTGSLLVYRQIQYFMQMMPPRVFVLKCQAEQNPQRVCVYLFVKVVFLFRLTV